jgi:hypothetical protein
VSLQPGPDWPDELNEAWFTWAYTDGLGRFEIRARARPAMVALFVQANGFTSPKLVVPVGSTGVEIELQDAGSIAGRLPPGSSWPRLEVFAGGSELLTWSYSDPDTGDFQLKGLPQGTVTLTARYAWSDGQIEIPDIAVAAGEETRDPRLDPLDLSSILPTITFTVTDDHGDPIPVVRALVRLPDHEEFVDCGARQEGDRVTVAAGPLPLHVKLEARGFRSLELVGVDSDRAVVLEPGILVRLVLAGDLPELPAGWGLGGSAVFRQSARFLFSLEDDDRASHFDWTDGMAELRLSSPGTYALAHRLVQQHAGKTWTEDESEEQTTFDVVDTTELQVIEVSMPQATLEAFQSYLEKND